MSSVTESGDIGTELRAGETLAKVMVCKEVGIEECEDIMVEVLGSEVFVDGVCTSSGDGIGEDGDEEDVGRGGGNELGEVVQEKAMRFVDGEELGLVEAGDSAWEALDCGNEMEDIGYDGGSIEELLEDVERCGSKENGGLAVDVHNWIVENGVGRSSADGELSVGIDTVSSTVVESVGFSTVASAKPESIYAAGAEIDRKGNGVSACSVAERMKNSVCDEEHANGEVGGEGIEDRNNSIGKEVGDEDLTVLSNSEKGHQLRIDGSLDQGLVHGLRHIKSVIAERIEFDPQSVEKETTAEDGVSSMGIVVENTGNRQESSMRDSVDKSGSGSFVGRPLLDGGVETLRSQDRVFSEDSNPKNSETKRSVPHKPKHNLRDMYLVEKERNMYELMDETLDISIGDIGPEEKATDELALPTAANKCKSFDSPFDDLIQDTEKHISKQSCKVGECIQRAATQLNGFPLLRCNNDSGDNYGVSLEDLEDAQMILPAECSSFDEFLSQLHLAARDPFQGYSFLNSVVSFFSDFRDSVVPSQNSVMNKGGAKRKMTSHSVDGFPETFDFVDMNDSYWTDMVVQNGSLQQLSQNSKKGECQNFPVALESDKSVQAGRRPYSRKRYRVANNEQTAETHVYIDERRRVSPAEIIMTFSTVNSVPAETKLNKMFRRFGPLKESETEVDRETFRARVVYKKGSDAEVAYSSAGKFNIFGPVVVNYQLNFYPFEPFKALYIPSMERMEEATLYFHSQH